MFKKARQVKAHITSTPGKVAGWFASIKDGIELMRKGLKDLPGTNIELAKYHLENGNVSDAIFRLKIIDRFFKTDNPEAKLVLGWCYFVKGEYMNALEKLEQVPKTDTDNLAKFIKEINIVKKIPDGIYAQFRNIKADEIVNLISSPKVNLVREFVDMALPHLNELPDEYKVLEVGFGSGVLGSELRTLLPDMFTLEGSEIASEMVLLEEAYFGEEGNYNELQVMPAMKFLKNNQKQVELIVSLGGLAFTSELDGVFSSIKNRLKKNGHFVYMARVDDKTYLDKNTLEFVVSNAEILTAFEKNKFEILDSKQFLLENNSKFSIFVVKNT